MSVERLLAHNYANWFSSTSGIGGGILGYVGRGCLPRLLGKCLLPYVREGRHREGGVGQAQPVSVTPRMTSVKTGNRRGGLTRKESWGLGELCE